jgi:hypothetical protein
MKQALQIAVAQSFHALDPSLPFADRVKTACAANNVKPPVSLFPSALKWLARPASAVAATPAATAKPRRTPRPPVSNLQFPISNFQSPLANLLDACDALRLAIAHVVRESVDRGLADGLHDASAILVAPTSPTAAPQDITARAIARIERELADPAVFDGRKAWLRDQLRELRAKQTAATAAAKRTA